uniref:Transposase n=1 Tax=Panagrellus redivivus TaxID=6233 RepID=A0A7E4UVU6_PANRE
MQPRKTWPREPAMFQLRRRVLRQAKWVVDSVNRRWLAATSDETVPLPGHRHANWSNYLVSAWGPLWVNTACHTASRKPSPLLRPSSADG